MKINKIKQQPNNTALAKIEFKVEHFLGSLKSVTGGILKFYSITDESKEKIRLITREDITAPDPIQLVMNQWYEAEAMITERGLTGIKYTEAREKQNIEVNAKIIKKTTQKTMTPEQNKKIQPPQSKSQLENYCLSLYFETKTKALTKEGTTKEEAHDIGLKMMELVPLYWFGEKQLP